ncbi:MAG: DUF6550 family protein [Oscillospiraceae bacterium]|jgi:hypothetical protein|uniref:DUF6550 family protein n=1 Tax=Anaerotruncus colihominis TaxID=169435 RepID=UPI00267331C1|nr:DUF6550 family protein [Anaerotruncus colihominis]
MTENTKKWLTVAGCLVVCAILVAVIASSFSKDKVTDDPLPPSSSQQGDVVVDPDSSTPPPAEFDDSQEPGDDVTVNLETPDANTNTGEGNGADFTGTEQTIQGDPVKPEYTEEELKDPTKTPDGTPVEGSPEPQDHNNVTPPPEQPPTNTSGGLPGFDNVPNAGENQVTEGHSDGDINTQVGIMG